MFFLFVFLMLSTAGFSQSTLNFPKFFSAAELPNSGFAILNPGSAAANVTFTLYGANGNVVSTSTLATESPFAAGSQRALTGDQIFPTLGTGGWVQVTGPTTGLQGLWLNYNSALTYLDGAEAAATALNETIPLVAGSTDVNIANPNSTVTVAFIQLLASNGTQLAPQVVETIPAYGVFHSDAFALFGLPVQAQPCYVRVLSGSTNALAVTAVVRNYLVPVEDGVVNGVDESSTATQLNFPHVISGPLGSSNYTTVFGVTNLSNLAQMVTVSFFAANGSSSTAVQLQLAGRGTLSQPVQNLFNLPTNVFEDGWIQATGSAPITGFAAYADLIGGAFTVVPPAKPSGSTNLVFAQIANLPPWQTGIALLNPGTIAANVKIYAMTPSGTLIGGATTDPATAVLTLAPGSKMSLGLSQMIPEAGAPSATHPSDGGFLFVQSTNNVPIYGIELFYDANGTILSSVPAGTLASGISYTPPASVAIPAGIQSITFSSNSVASGGTVTGTIGLSTAAPTGGAAVTLLSSSSAASVPATVSVPAGATSAAFAASAGTVSSIQAVTITASYNGTSAQANLTVTPGATGSTSGIITTVAGGGSGDGVAATAASLDGARNVAVDASGNLFIADTLHSRIRKVSTSGIITTVAGNGSPGYSGDGGPATSAELKYPFGVAVDASGNLFIADASNYRIRKVSAANGLITTVAGNGIQGYSGDGGSATLASLWPYGVVVDASGNLLIADTFNNRIRKVSTSGVITTIAGNGSPGYSGDGGPATSAEMYDPFGVAVDAFGNLFIADTANNLIRKVSTSGVITTVAGNGNAGYAGDGGPATSAALSPYGVAVDATGNLLIADMISNRIRKVSISGVITTVAGNGIQGYSGDGGPAISAEMYAPFGIAVDASGNFFFADTTNNRVRKVPVSGIIMTVAGDGSPGYSGDGGAATSAEFSYTYGVAVDGSGDLFIADTANNRIRKVSTNGIITTVAGNGSPGYSGDGGPASSAELYDPFGVAVDASGNLFIADTANNRIRKVLTSGIITTVAGNGIPAYSGDGGPATSADLYNPFSVAVDAFGNLLIADTFNNLVRKVSTNGIITTVAGNGIQGYFGDGAAAISAELYYPEGVAVDASGNLLIADTFNDRIRKVSNSGLITTVAGNGIPGYSGDGGAAILAELYYPESVAVDVTGNLFVADTNNNRIRKVSVNSGIVTTVAGSGILGYFGDGGPATSAGLASPFSVAVDATGNLFIGDTDNDRIREVGIQSLTFSSDSGVFGAKNRAIAIFGVFHPRSQAERSVGLDPIGDCKLENVHVVFPLVMAEW